MNYASILTREDVPQDVKKVISNLEGQLDTYRTQIERLRESEEKFRILFESAPIAVGTSDLDGKALTFNQKTLEMMGYTADELRTIDLNDTYVNPKDREEILHTLRREGSIVDYEVLRRRKDGSEQYQLLNSQLIQFGEKQVFLTTMRDITDQKKAEKEAQRSKEALADSEKRFRELADLLPEVIFEMDKEMNIRFANQVAFEKFGYTREDFEDGLNALQMIVPEETDLAIDDLKRIINGGTPIGRETTALTKYGSTFPCLVFINRIVSDNEPVGFRGILVDVTEKKQAEEAIRIERDRVRQYVDASGGIMFALTPQGDVTLINKMGCQILGYDESEVIGKNWFQEFIPERIQNELQLIFDAFIARKTRGEIEELFESLLGSEFEFRVNPIITKSGDERLILWANSLIEDELGNVIGVISSGQDITERHQMEKELKESERKLQAIMDAIQTGIVIIDAQSHKIVDANPMAIAMIDSTKDEIVNSVCHEFICPSDQGLCPICDLGQKVDRSERLLQRANGELLPILKTANVMVLDEKEYILESFVDITERKQNEELMQAQRDLSIALNATTNLEQALELIINTALKIKEIDSGGIYLINKETGDLFLAQYKGVADDFLQNVSLIRADDPRAELVMKGKPIYGTHQQVVPSVTETRLKEGIVALGVIPVLVEGKVIAALNVASHSVREIPNHSQNILEAIAAQIGSILELLKTEEALRASRERYQMLVEKLEEGIVLEDAEGYITFVNPKAAEMLGWQIEEVLGRHWSQLIINSQHELVLKESNKRPKGISSSYEVNLQKKDGTPIPVIVAATPIITPEGKYDGTISVFTNIAERKRAEEEVKKERDLAQKYLDTAGVMMLAIEANQQVSLINKKGCEILGYEEKDILGKNWFKHFIPERDRERVISVFNRLMSGEIEPLEYGENPIVTKSGEEKIIAWHNTVLKDKKGKITGTLSSGEDISERIEAERIRQELEERRENFIYMTTHELRTPLTVIGGYCDFLSEHDEFIDHPRREKIYSILRSNVNRLERLTRDVSHIVQLERGEFLIEKEEVNVCSFLKSILEPYDHLLGSQFSFQTCFEEPSAIIHADSDRLQQVMENIISNAIKHTSKDSREITVSMESSNDKIRILVKDNGAGIASKHLETIFEQFITIPTDYTAIGTGIGLYLSREIIKAHEGTITAQSKGKGKGSTFTIELPRAS